MEEKILSLVFCSNSYIQNFIHHEKFYLYSAKKLKKIYFINTYYLKSASKIKLSEYDYIKNKFPKNIFIFEPKTYIELNNFLAKKKLITFLSIGRDISFFRILYLLKKNKCIIAINHSIGYYRDKKFFLKKNNLIIFFQFLIKKKLSFIFFRILVFLNYLPKVDIIFEGSKENKKIYDNLYDRKYFKWLNFNYIQKVVHVNFRGYDNIIDKINLTKIENKYIVFIDSGFDHPDVLIQEGKHTSEQAKVYYSLLKQTLIKISNIYKKEIIICLHPKTNLFSVQKYLKGIKIVKFRTLYYIFKSFMVLYHNSSLVLDAIFLNKKIINLQSDVMGKFYIVQNKLFSDKFKSPVLNMNNFINNKIAKINFQSNMMNTSNFIKKYMTVDIKSFKKIIKNNSKNKLSSYFTNFKNKPGYIQMYIYLKNKYNIS
jgi:hypothetical protein